MIFDLSHCTVCPRECGADRTKGIGVCGEGSEMRIAKAMLHHWEEPCISGKGEKRGSGAIFFSGCPLKCVFCQNREISRGGSGQTASPEELCEIMRSLVDSGAYNINFVTPTHFIPQIIASLTKYRPPVPTVFNTGGYEKAKSIRALSGCADIFLTDFKYGSQETAAKYSKAADYPEKAISALAEMVEITDDIRFDSSGMLQSGVIIRHLILPGERHDSIKALRMIAAAVPPERVLLSLMSQYTPDFAPDNMRSLHRRITSFEYESVRDEALRLGFNGYSQDITSAKSGYTPDFR